MDKLLVLLKKVIIINKYKLSKVDKEGLNTMKNNKLESLKLLEINISALKVLLTENRVSPKVLKEISKELVEYAAMYDEIVSEGLDKEVVDRLGQKRNIEVKLSQGYLRSRLPEVVEHLLVLIGQAKKCIR